MISILFLDHAEALGGAEYSLLWLIEQLQASSQWRPHLACPPGALADGVRALGAPVYPVAMPRLRRSSRLLRHWLSTARDIAAIARDVDAAILHTNTIRATMYGILAARLARRPLIWHMRDFWLSETPPTRPQLDDGLKRILCAASTRVIANSRATAAHLPCPAKIEVVYNGIPIHQYDVREPGIEPFFQEWGIPSGAPVVGMAGRLRPWKGQRVFLQMAAYIHRQRPDVHFLIVGGSPFGKDDAYVRELQALVARSNLTNFVTFTGHLSDIGSALAAMTIFVHPGEPEPFGLVNIEAMAMGKPVIAFAHGALPEIVTPETGILVPPGDVNALAKAALSLLARPEYAAGMGKAGQARARSSFSMERAAREIQTIYQSVFSRGTHA